MTDLQTGLLLGLYALLAGLYGLAYAVGYVGGSRTILKVSAIFCGMHLSVLLVIAAWTPLAYAWKLTLGVNSAILIVIPALTLRLLQKTHSAGTPPIDPQL